MNIKVSYGSTKIVQTSDETGLAESEPVYLGKYDVREIVTPTGYVLDTEVPTAELVYAGQGVEITKTADGLL